MEEYRLVLFILGVAIPIVGIQYLIARFTKSLLLIYLFPILTFALTLFFLFVAYYVPLEGFANLGYIVMAMFSAGVFIVSLIAAFVLHKHKMATTK